MNKKLLIVDVAALGADFEWDKLPCRPIDSVFPAVTCAVQGSFRTASPPSRHGIVGNGWFFRDLGRPMFWEQSAALLGGRRIWEGLRRRGGRVGQMFWQQSLAEDVDLVLSPAPIHKHGGGMIQDCFSTPAGLYRSLCDAVGSRFNLMRYWGPLASAKVGDWITSATATVMRTAGLAPELLLTYLPSLDYDLQRWGPRHPRCEKAKTALRRQLDLLWDAAEQEGYDMLIFGDCAVGEVSGGAVLPNVALAQAKLLNTREVGGMSYPDLHTGEAFAVVDHEIAHVYVRRPEIIPRVREILAAVPGVGEVMGRDARAAVGLDHPNSGELVLLAERGHWLAYPWWPSSSREPDYARHVDIHNKPGYDPCELFFGWPPMSISRNTSRIGGTHGRVGEGRNVAWASTLPVPGEPATLIDLAAVVRDYLDETP